MAIQVTVNASIGQIQWDFEAGQQATLHVGRLSKEVMAYAALHGLKQKCGDVMALKAEDFGGRVPEVAKLEALQAMIQWLETGTSEWNRKVARESNGGLLLAALMRYRGDKTRDELQAFIKTLDAGSKAKLLASDKIRPIADEIRAESGRGIDADAMLSGLDGDLDAQIAEEMKQDE